LQGFGDVAAHLSFHPEGITYQVTAHVEEFGYPYGGERELLPPIECRIWGLLESEPGFERFDLKGSRLEIYPFLWASWNASLSGSNQRLTLVVDSLRIDHASVGPFLPADLRKIFSQARLKGETRLTLRYEAKWAYEGESGKEDPRPTLVNGQTLVRQALSGQTRSGQALGGQALGERALSGQGLSGQAFRGRLLTLNPEFFDPVHDMKVEDFSMQADFSGNSRQVQATLRGEFGALRWKDALPRPLGRTSFQARLEWRTPDTLRIRNLGFWQTDWQIHGQAEGIIEGFSPQPRMDIQLDVKGTAEDTIWIDQQTYARGLWRLSVRARSVQEGGSGEKGLLEVKGLLDVQNLDLGIGREVALYGVAGQIPFRHHVNLGRWDFPQASKRELPAALRDVYSNFEPYITFSDLRARLGPARQKSGPARKGSGPARQESGPARKQSGRARLKLLSELQVDSVRVFGYGLKNFRAWVLSSEGSFWIPRFRFEAYGGNMVGRLHFWTPALDLQKVAYELKADLARMRLARLPGARFETLGESEIAATMAFRGEGLDPQRRLDIEGRFEFTQIGAKAADNLLRSIDPRGSDRAIQNVRWLLNHGFRPRLISFEIRHGNVYPVIRLHQPWYSPLRISGGRIALSRIPLRFLFELIAPEQ